MRINVYLDIINYLITMEEFDISIGMIYDDIFKCTRPINDYQIRTSSKKARLLWDILIMKHGGSGLHRIRRKYENYSLEELYEERKFYIGGDLNEI